MSKDTKTKRKSPKAPTEAIMTFSSRASLKPSKLGRELIIKKTQETFELGSFQHYGPCIQVTIGIGNDHCAYLTMSLDAWEELKKGAKIL